MDRVIEFRGKRFNKNEWVYGYLVHCRNTTTIENEECGWVVDPSTIGQYTGLKDKNGKKIFEGDIFTLGSERILYIVEWIDIGLKGRQNGNSSTVGLSYWKNNIEVIGNIHDNPELLEEKV